MREVKEKLKEKVNKQANAIFWKTSSNPTWKRAFLEINNSTSALTREVWVFCYEQATE